MQALADGKADDALSFASHPPADPTFLTDLMLAASLSINPITDVEVTLDEKVSPSIASLTATYKIGDTIAETSFRAEKQGKFFFLDEVASGVSILGNRYEGPAMTINDLPLVLDDDYSYRVYLFPGTYLLEQDNPHLTISDNQFLVTDFDSFPDTNYTLALRVDKGLDFGTVAKNTFWACMKEKATFNACGFGAGSASEVDDPEWARAETTKWSVKGSVPDFSDLDFQYSQFHPQEVTATTNFIVRQDVKWRKGNSYYYLFRLKMVTIDFSDPESLRVSFTGCPIDSTPRCK